MSQVGVGLGAAGLALVAGGVVFGLWPVGEDCGSGWSPDAKGSGVQKLACSAALAGRSNTAWELTLIGASLTLGGVVTVRSGDRPST